MGWIRQEKAGRSFNVLLQEQEADCGLCCVAMVVNLLGQGSPTSDIVKNKLKKGAYKPSTVDRSGFVPTALAAVRPDVATHSLGTYLASLQPALTDWQIDSELNGPSPNVQAAITGAIAGKPIVCHVTWTTGGGHWVVITHSMGMSHYVLDPYYGLTINSSLHNYEGLQQSGVGSVAKTRYGRWTGEWLQINPDR